MSKKEPSTVSTVNLAIVGALMLALTAPLSAAPPEPDGPTGPSFSEWVAAWWETAVARWTSAGPRPSVPAASDVVEKNEPADDAEPHDRHYLQIEPGG